MTDKPNCSNCSRHHTRTGDGCINSTYSGMVDTMTPQLKDWVNTHGCLSHPNARKYLMTDVIKELERIKIADNPYHEDEGFEHGIEKAISLIRDGVKP